MVSARIPVSAMSADRSTGALLRKEKSHGHHQIDILRSLRGEDSYGVAVSASHGLFGGFLLHREVLTALLSTGFTSGSSSPRSFGQREFRTMSSGKQEGPYIPGLNAGALRPEW